MQSFYDEIWKYLHSGDASTYLLPGMNRPLGDLVSCKVHVGPAEK